MQVSDKHKSRVFEKLHCQVQAGHFCDVDLVLNGKVFNAHRNILAAHSEYFLSIFKKHVTVKEKLVIERCNNHFAFRLLLNFMYTGEILIDWDTVPELIKLSHEFQIEEVKHCCELYMRNHIDSSNCFMVYCLSTKYNFTELNLQAVNFIQNNSLKILEQRETLDLTLKKLKMLLKLIVCPQFNLLRFISRWVEDDVENRKDSLSDILVFVDWEKIDSASLEVGLTECTLFANSKTCLNVLLSHFQANNIEFKSDALNSALISTSEKILNNAAAALVEVGTSKSDKQGNKFQTDIRCVEPKRSRKARNPRRICNKEEELESNSSFENLKIKFKRIKPLNEKRNIERLLPIKKRKKISHLKQTARPKISQNSTPENKSLYKFKCHLCTFHTMSEIKLKSHVHNLHQSNKTYKCIDCDYTWKLPSDYDKHLKVHYAGSPFHCKRCDFETTQMRYLSQHLFKHSTEKPFSCYTCDKTFKSPRQVIAHEIIHAKDYQTDAETSITEVQQFTHKPRQLKGEAKCEKCSFASHSAKLLKNHIATVHETDAIHKCVDCDFEWTWIRDYTIHLRTHYESPPFQCKLCSYSNHILLSFAYHLFRHSDKHEFKCVLCGESFKALQRLRYHRKKCRAKMRDENVVSNEIKQESVPKKRFKCTKCTLTCDSEQKLSLHIESFHAADAAYKCHECDFMWKNPNDYSMHLKRHYTGPPFKCKECSYSAKRIYTLSRHIFMHRDDRPFKCGMCSTSFKSPQHLQKHIHEKHTLEKFSCDKCSSQFPTRKKLENHVIIHENPNAFLCDVCGWRANTMTGLYNHKFTHKKVHECDYPGCSYKTAYKRLILSHTLRHKGEFPYICCFCGKKFLDPTVLKTHELHKCGKTPNRPKRKNRLHYTSEDDTSQIRGQSNLTESEDSYHAAGEHIANNPSLQGSIYESQINWPMPITSFPTVPMPLSGDSELPISQELPGNLRSFFTFM